MNAARAAALALMMATGLGGCGFTPLYATPGVTPGLTHIEVVAPGGRVGFLLRQNLDDALAHDKDGAAAYRLEMQVSQTRNARGLQVDNTAQRYELDLSVTYSLVDAASGKTVHTGQVASVVSYDSTAQPYAGIAARQDTQDRLAADAARKIQLDLAAWMATRKPG